MAFLIRAEEADASEDAKRIEPFARSLARSMAGMSSPDGLDPDWARGIEDSQWAVGKAARLMALAEPMAAALLESMDLGSGIDDPPGPGAGKAKPRL